MPKTELQNSRIKFGNEDIKNILNETSLRTKFKSWEISNPFFNNFLKQTNDLNIRKAIENYKKTFEKIRQGINPVPFKDRGIGIEIEVDNIESSMLPSVYPASIWKWSQDSSLGEKGVEFISVPLLSQMTPEALSILWASFETFNKNLSFDWRTSTHIHLDVREKTYEYVVLFLLVYLIFEESLFEYAQADRKQSIFCVPLSETEQLIGDTKRFINGETPFDSLAHQWRKYCAINLRPILQHGTIEFRQMAGTNDVNKIVNWINLILSMDSFVSSTKLNDFIPILQSINTTSAYGQLKEQVFGNYKDLLVDYNLQKHMSVGARRAKECIPEVFDEEFIKKTENSSAFAYLIKGEPKLKKSESGDQPVEINQDFWQTVREIRRGRPPRANPIWDDPPSPSVRLERDSILDILEENPSHADDPRLSIFNNRTILQYQTIKSHAALDGKIPKFPLERIQRPFILNQSNYGVYYAPTPSSIPTKIGTLFNLVSNEDTLDYLNPYDYAPQF